MPPANKAVEAFFLGQSLPRLRQKERLPRHMGGEEYLGQSLGRCRLPPQQTCQPRKEGGRRTEAGHHLHETACHHLLPNKTGGQAAETLPPASSNIHHNTYLYYSEDRPKCKTSRRRQYKTRRAYTCLYI